MNISSEILLLLAQISASDFIRKTREMFTITRKHQFACVMEATRQELSGSRSNDECIV